ncbi:MAG: hypothetical protein JXA07_08330 [Spirochaetes bacterium]|nr:hypothetical protein [Spirochaetota bacterium]
MKKISIMLILFVQLAVAVSCSKKGIMEKEPNNTFSTAGSVTVDAPHLGFMQTPEDRDFYIISIEEQGAVDIRVSGVRGINLAFKIWRGEEEPRLIKVIDDNRKSSPERMPNLSVLPGIYYLELFQSPRDPKKINNEIPYELTLKLRDMISEESEPNDSMDDADTLYPDREIIGYYAPGYNRMNEDRENLHREEDWYVMDIGLDPDKIPLLDLSLSGVTGVNSIMALYDSEGTLMVESDNGQMNEPETISGAGIKKPGSYYILVASRGYAANNDEPYRLNAVLREHDSGSEFEPNDDFESANPISNNIVTATIHSKDDSDVFLYELSEGPSLFRIELKPPEDMNAILSIYGEGREKIIDINAGGRGKKEVYPNFFADDKFYIGVTAKTGEKLPTDEYILTVTRLGDSESQEREPNNDIAHAGIVTGNSISGYTSARGDRDFFRLAYDMRVKERFEVSGPDGGAIKVSITDPLGYIIKSVEVSGDRKMIFNEMIDKKGYIIIDSVREDFDNPYTIILRGVQ